MKPTLSDELPVLDDYLRIQNLRWIEEERFTRASPISRQLEDGTRILSAADFTRDLWAGRLF